MNHGETPGLGADRAACDVVEECIAGFRLEPSFEAVEELHGIWAVVIGHGTRQRLHEVELELLIFVHAWFARSRGASPLHTSAPRTPLDRWHAGRYIPDVSQSVQRFELGAVHVDLERRVIVRAGKQQSLTRTEVSLLAHLAGCAPSPASEEELLREVWGYASGVQTRAVANAVGRLRKKLEPDAAEPSLLLSVYGQGYRLELAAAPVVALDVEGQGNLETPPSSFVGRRSELMALHRQVHAGARLVGIVGRAGLGKTRFATQYARWRLAEGDFPGGAFQVSPTRLDPLQAAAEIAENAGVSLAPTRDLTVAALGLGQALGEAVLVVDGSCPESLHLELARCTKLVQLVIGAAYAPSVVEVGPLSLDDARALFLERAGAVRFGLAQGVLLDQVLERLEGHPMAIELAATWLGSIDMADLLRRLQQVHAPDALLSALRLGDFQASTDRFFGRERELSRLSRELESGVRCVQLVGPAGVGKTRLSLEFCARAAASYAGGVWFCDLSHCTSREAAIAVVAKVLGITVRSDPSVEVAVGLTAKGAALVVLDNLEQLVGPPVEIRAVIDPWLVRGVQFLITTRTPVSTPSLQIAVEPLDQADANALFVERARAMHPQAECVPEDVDAIVQRLDRLPLAIELAAGRAQVLSARQIRDRLDDRFALLRGVGGEPSQRHLTLHNALEWSWLQLREAERHVLAQLSVFRSPFAIEAAEAVVIANGSVLDAVHSLVQNSLLLSRQHEGEIQLDLLLSIREFAMLKLEDASGVQRRHADYFRDTAYRGDGAEWQSRVEDLLAATRWSIGNESAWAAELGCVALKTLRDHGSLNRGAALASELAVLQDLPLHAQAQIALQRAEMLHVAGRPSEAIEQALSCAEQCGDPVLLAEVLCAAAAIAKVSQKPKKALELVERVLELEGSGLAARALSIRGGVLKQLGDLPGAEAAYRSALEAFAGTHPLEEAEARGYLGNVLNQRGQSAQALEQQKWAVSAFQELGARRREGRAICNMGVTYIGLDRLDEAAELFLSAARIARDLGDPRTGGLAAGNLGAVRHRQGRRREARKGYEQAISFERTVGNRRLEGAFTGYLANLDFQAGAYAAARNGHTRAVALSREVEDVPGEAVALGNLTASLLAAGEVDAAIDAMERAVELSREIGEEVRLGRSLGALGVAYAAGGRAAEALMVAMEGVAILEPLNQKFELALALGSAGMAWVASGETSRARELLDQVVALGEILDLEPDSEVWRMVARLEDAVCS